MPMVEKYLCECVCACVCLFYHCAYTQRQEEDFQCRALLLSALFPWEHLSLNLHLLHRSARLSHTIDLGLVTCCQHAKLFH